MTASARNKPLHALVLYNTGDAPPPPPVVASAATTSSEPEPAAEADLTPALASASAAPAAPADSVATAPADRDPNAPVPDAIAPVGATLLEPDEQRVRKPRYLTTRDQNPPSDVRAIAEALTERFIVSAVDIGNDVDRVLAAIAVERPTFVFTMVEEFEEETTQAALIASLLDLLGVAYTGSEPLVLASCQNRVRTHLFLADAGVPVPRFAVVRDINAVPDTDDFCFPVIATQAFDDVYAEEGIDHPISNRDKLVSNIAELAKEFDLPFLIEEYIGERRLHAVILGNRVLEILPLIAADGDEMSLAQVDADTAGDIRQLARRAFRALDCRDFAQVDFHLDGNGRPHVVDVRTIIDFAAGSPFEAAAEADERGFNQTIAELVRITCARNGIDICPPPPDEARADADTSAAPTPAGAEPKSGA